MAFFGWVIRRHVENAPESNLDAQSTPDERRFAHLGLRKRALIRLIQEIDEEMLILRRRIHYDKELRSGPIENVG
jgi:hypothetical protein